jgi:hypothetical protein
VPKWDSIDILYCEILSGIAPYKIHKIHNTARYLLPCSAPAPPAHLPTAALLLVRHHCARTRTRRLHPHPRPSLRTLRSACLPAPATPLLSAARASTPCACTGPRPHCYPVLFAPLVCPDRLQPPPTCTLFLWRQPAAQSLVGSEYPAGSVLQGVELVCGFPGYGNAHVPHRFHLLRQAPLPIASLLYAPARRCATSTPAPALNFRAPARPSRSLVSTVHRSLKPPSHPPATHFIRRLGVSVAMYQFGCSH